MPRRGGEAEKAWAVAPSPFISYINTIEKEADVKRYLITQCVGLFIFIVVAQAQDDPTTPVTTIPPAEASASTETEAFETLPLDAESTGAAEFRSIEALPEAAEISASGFVEGNLEEIPLNRIFQFVIEVTSGKPLDADRLNISDLSLEGLELSKKETSASEGENGQSVVRVEYTLQPTDIGVATIGRANVIYRDPETLRPSYATVEPLSIQITEAKGGWLYYTGMIVGILLVIGAIGAAALVFLRQPTQERRVEHEEDLVTPWDRLKAEMTVLERKAMLGETYILYEKGEKWLKTLFACLLDNSVRQFSAAELRDRFGDDARLPAAMRDQAFSLLERCEQVRFSSKKPSDEEHQQMYRDCAQLLEACREQLQKPVRHEADEAKVPGMS